MENSLKLQMDVRNNAEELQRYMLDLQNWEDEMKKKEIGLKNEANKVVDIPPPRNKIKRNITDGQGNGKRLSDCERKPKKIHAYDYSAWDKYDVQKACAQIDEEPEENPESSQENTQENQNEGAGEEEEKENAEVDKSNFKKIDEAFYEKELGNQFVRKSKWEEAIKCYTRAIELDSRNAIYYANRALCFMKLKNFRSAEVDATVAIQLDNTYVKAYQRRAFARLALNQIEEALTDYKEIAKLEPNNAQANAEIVKIESRLKSGATKCEKKVFDPKMIFKSEPKKVVVAKSNQKVEEKKDERAKVKIARESSGSETDEKKKVNIDKSPEVKKKDDVFDKIPDGFAIVKPVHVPPHLRSKKPLRRVPVKDITSDSETFDEFITMSNSMPSGDDTKEKKPENIATIRDETPDTTDIESLAKPETFLQFQQSWKIVKTNPEHAITYLQKTTPKTLYRILRHNLESDLFSELISVLSSCVEANSELVYSILVDLTNADRFGSLVLFLSPTDKMSLTKCVEGLQSARTDRELRDLREFYGLGRVV